MREGIVLISTHDLQLAGRLRTAFREEEYDVDLIPPSEDIEGRDEAVLLVLTGGLDGESGMELAETARDELHVPVYGVLDREEEGWRRLVRDLGLSEIFFKPVAEDEVVLLGRTLIERRRLQEVTGIVGETEVMREVLERVVQIAPVPSTALITGESGTGKELVARGIHALSPRRHKPFIAVNVAALSETLLESELFGHEKGAFTGAVDTRKGFFELATGGTIFLDEIGEMPLATQTKLLRVLEQREFIRVGGEAPIRVDVRIVAATNQNLRQLVAIGDFRRDLYYRLNVLRIELPALRERTKDIPLLIDEFIEEISRSHDRSFAGISEGAMEILTRYHWPGNVRELRNLVESMVVLSPGRQIEPRDIPDEIRHSERLPTLLPSGSERPAGPSGRPGLPAHAGETEAGVPGEGADRDYRPELEFIFRTLMELRLDLTDLQREFEEYKAERGSVPGGMREIALAGEDDDYELRVISRGGDGGEGGAAESSAGGRDDVEVEGDGSAVSVRDHAEDGRVVYRSGMTMEDLEREAILAALDEVGGNRRKAAEILDIGERTLYRKIQKYDLDV